MTKFSRRLFCQGVSFTVASVWGWANQNPFHAHQIDSFAATLDSPNIRKLALLVGINEYSGKNLKGCVSDVELQRKLLIYRFGFSPTDIITLTDKNATRENILNSFQQHLLQQAKANDVVVFHFSGYGRQVKLPSSADDSSPVNSLITYDSISQKNQQVNDILLDTLIRLAKSLKTGKYTLILDTSFIPSSLEIRNKLSLRSYQFNPELTISDTEYQYYQQLKTNSILTNPLNREKSLSGFLLSPDFSSASIEINSLHFQAGLFTYNLTQSLWQSFPETNNYNVMKRVAKNISLYQGSKEKINTETLNNNNDSSYHLPLDYERQGSAIVTKISPSGVELELVGLSLLLLSNYGINSCFKAINQNKNVIVQINYLEGNKAKGTVLKNEDNYLKEGLILQEYIRVISDDIGLNIALNDTLEKIEKVDATSALSVISKVVSVSKIGETFADSILDKITHDKNNVEGYGLYSPTGVLYPNSSPKNPHEAVSTAIKRLTSPLKITLASKLLNLTHNQYSSRLPVNVTLTVNTDKSSSYTQEYTINSKFNQTSPQTKLENDDLLINIPLGSQFKININNENNFDLYYLLLGINSSRQGIAYFSSDNYVINSLESVTFPEIFSPLKWIVNASKGTGELILICAKSPFNKTLNKLYQNSNIKPEVEQVIILDNPEIIAKSVLEDLHEGSNLNHDLIGNLTGVYALKLSDWATFRFVYNIV